MATSARTQSESITGGQIGQINDRLGTKLRESGLPSAGVQNVLAAPGGAAIDEMVAVLRKHVEANSDLIVRIVSVNRARSGNEALKATSRNLYVSNDVVKAMPNGQGDQIELVFFKPKSEEYTRPGFMSDDDLEKALALRNLDAADPFSIAAHNEVDPAFADERPNATHWKDGNDRWCYAAFGRWRDERDVGVNRSDGGWRDGWWFVGVRKSA
jgi:hypothetical protein